MRIILNWWFFVSIVMFLTIALLLDLPAVISPSFVPHVMKWAVKFMGSLNIPMLSRIISLVRPG